MATLERRPREAVSFALYGLDDLTLAWSLAHSLTLDDSVLWQELAKRYEKVEPLAVLPIHTQLVLADLENAGAGHYRSAARRLARMRTLASGSAQAAGSTSPSPSTTIRAASPAWRSTASCSTTETPASGWTTTRWPPGR